MAETTNEAGTSERRGDPALTRLSQLLSAGSLPWRLEVSVAPYTAVYSATRFVAETHPEHAALIVAAVNSLPALLREREALLAFVDSLPPNLRAEALARLRAASESEVPADD